MTKKPRLFLASSIEAREVLTQLETILKPWYDVELWTADFFQPGVSTIDSITSRIWDFDGGVFVLTPDDLLYSRERVGWTPRANVLFELGLFAGVLGIENCIQVVLKAREDPCKSLKCLVDGNLAIGNCNIDQTSSTIEPNTPSAKKYGIDTITDLAGITWIESNCEMEERYGRNSFSLNDTQVKSLSQKFQHRYEKDERLLASLRKEADLEVIWEEGGKQHIAPVCISTFGDRVRLRYGWEAGDREYVCSLKFVAPDKLEGRWWDAQDRGYSGTAVFQIRHRPPQLLGQWSGCSSNGGVKSGTYSVRAKENRTKARFDMRFLQWAHQIRTFVEKIL